ncbi:hypothetical protein [Synechococcus sp.]
MKTLIKTLAHGLSLEGETRPLAPTVYTTAIRSEGALVESLAGIAQIAQGLGFTRYRETIYSSDGLSATYHAEHDDWAVSLAIDCCTLRKTASLAVSGVHNDEAYVLFNEASAQLFGDC